MTRLEAPTASVPTRVITDYTAEAPGPTLIAVGGIHGNEPAGIEAAQAVRDLISDTSCLRRGRFAALRGNLAALAIDPDNPHNNPRYLSHDLNRLFSRNGVANPGPEAPIDLTERDQLRAVIDGIVRDASGPTYLIDLHTVSSDSPPFIAVEDALPARRFAEAFPLPLVLGVEEELPGLLMDDTTHRLGCIALTIEGGRHDHPDAAHTLEAVLWIALETLGLVSGGARTTRGADPHKAVSDAAAGRAKHLYDMRHREPVRGTPYKGNPDLLVFESVRARSTRVASQAGKDLIAAESGLLFMPNNQRDPRVGDDAYFVVRRVGRFWLALSAALRTHPALHRSLPRILPGVRHRPGHANELLVDPEIAAVLRRELFHLLGYRLVRFDATPGLPRLTRARRALHLAAHALTMILINLVRQGSPDPAHPEQSTDWIVRRRRLDVDPPVPPGG